MPTPPEARRGRPSGCAVAATREPPGQVVGLAGDGAGRVAVAVLPGLGEVAGQHPERRLGSPRLTAATSRTSAENAGTSRRRCSPRRGRRGGSRPRAAASAPSSVRVKARLPGVRSIVTSHLSSGRSDDLAVEQLGRGHQPRARARTATRRRARRCRRRGPPARRTSGSPTPPATPFRARRQALAVEGQVRDDVAHGPVRAGGRAWRTSRRRARRRCAPAVGWRRPGVRAGSGHLRLGHGAIQHTPQRCRGGPVGSSTDRVAGCNPRPCDEHLFEPTRFADLEGRL